MTSPQTWKGYRGLTVTPPTCRVHPAQVSQHAWPTQLCKDQIEPMTCVAVSRWSGAAQTVRAQQASPRCRLAVPPQCQTCSPRGCRCRAACTAGANRHRANPQDASVTDSRQQAAAHVTCMPISDSRKEPWDLGWALVCVVQGQSNALTTHCCLCVVSASLCLHTTHTSPAQVPRLLAGVGDVHACAVAC